MTPERYKQIDELFHAAAELKPERRAAFLRQACGADKELFAELQELLEADAGIRGGSFLETPAIEAAGMVKLGQTSDSWVGRTFGSYEMKALVGSGGMGVVYRARDTKLKRDVAIKVLPEEFARDAERVARFQREAQILAALNHPHISSIHDLVHAGESLFLVLEFVDGETLAERIARGKLNVNEAMKIAHQILDALDAAHEKGVVHRDLKPSNVKITREGKVKVLDFGLAKANSSTGASRHNLLEGGVAFSDSPTIGSVVTGATVILGTAAYMSPEQAKGLKTDVRSDIFSFGAVLYEMLTGRQAFHGNSVPEILAQVMEREPDWNRLPADLKPGILKVLRRCLQKDLKRRWQDVTDLRLEVEEIVADPTGVASAPLPSVHRKPLWKRAAVPLALAALLMAIASIATWYLKPSASAPAPVSRFSFALPAGQQFTTLEGKFVAISPDGAQFVYAANNRLYLKPLRELRASPIPGTESAAGLSDPLFSPDGQFIAFWSAGMLKKVAINGGAPVTICTACTAVSPFGISWGANDQIVLGGYRGILRVSASGGEPETIITVQASEIAQGPQILPGGDAVLYTLGVDSLNGFVDWDSAQIVVQSLSSGERKTLTTGGSDAHYVPTGHIVYLLRGALLAVPFDLRRLEVTGPPAPVVDSVRTLDFVRTGMGQFSVSDSGSLAYIAGGAPPGVTQSELNFVDRTGNASPVGLSIAGYRDLRISPDGKQLAYSTIEGTEQNVWIYDLSGASSPRRLTFGGSVNHHPVWSPDGERILYRSNRESNDIAEFWQRADGTDAPERLTTPEPGSQHGADSFLPGGEQFFFVTLKPDDVDIWLFSIPEMKATPFVQLPRSEQGNAFPSPDGHWLAYQSNETGRDEIFVQPYPLTGGQFQITKDGGGHPLWSPDGKELFYENAGHLISVAIRTQPSFTFGNPVALPIPEIVQLQGNTPRQYDIMPDGKQFLVGLPPERTKGSSPSPQIQVVLNWFEELKQRTGNAN